MPYRSSDKTRAKKDTKRANMMRAAMKVFAEKGYHAATIRDIVGEADVAVGTFYFYFPDKESLFIHLYDETAEFLLQAIRQALNGRVTLPQQLSAALQAYANIALYEPAIVQLLLAGGMNAMPEMQAHRLKFRERMISLWRQPLDNAVAKQQVAPQDSRQTAEALTGAFDEVIINLLNQPDPESKVAATLSEMVEFSLRAVGYRYHD